MPKYKYTATDAAGVAVTGVIDGSTPTAAGLALMERDLDVSALSEHRSIMQFEITKKKVPRKELMQFSRQLAVFLRSGIPVIDALEVIQEELAKKSLFREVLEDMIEGLRAGSTLTAVVRAHPEAFPNFYVGVIEAAELTGHLDSALEEVANYVDRDLEARRKVQSALFYPLVVLLMSIVTVLVLTIFVLPRFEKFFRDLHAKLPLPTRMLLGATHWMTTYWPLLVGFFVVAGLTIGFGPRTTKGREIRDRLLLKTPVVGDLVRGSIVERFCRTLSSMVRTGVPLPDALIVTSDGTNNVVYRKGLNEVRSAMLQGEGLATPIARTGLFPGAARQMMRVGEETGTLDEQLTTAAEYYGRDLDFKIARFTSLFEPAVIMFMGVVVGFVAVALVSAMYGIFNQGNVG
jgi:type IV pilus assembly protein PilC